MTLKREPAFKSAEEVLAYLNEEDPLWGRIEKTPKGCPRYTNYHRSCENAFTKRVPIKIFKEMVALGALKIDEEVQRYHPKKRIYIPSDQGPTLRKRWDSLREKRAKKASAPYM